MGVRTVNSVWGFDPRWIRIEHLSDEGESLGVEFEPSGEPGLSKAPSRPPSDRHRFWLIWTLAGIASGVIAVATIAWAR